MIARFLVPVLLVVSSTLLRAQPQNSIDRSVREGQSAIYRLDFAAAEKIFQQIIRENPDSPVGFGMLAVTRWNQLLFAAKNLALEDYATPTAFGKKPTYKRIERERQRFLDANNHLIDVCKRIRQKHPSHALALYFEGVAYENLAGEAVAIGKDTGDAITYGRIAKNLHEEVLKREPGLIDANISIATHEFAAASLPWSIKWFAFLFGVRGSKERAFRRLEAVSERGKYRSLDAQVVMGLLHAWKGNARKSAAIFESLRKRFPENFLVDINLAAIHQLRLKDGLSAVRIFEELLHNLDKKAPGIHAAEVHYRIGKAYMQLNDYSKAAEAFTRALASRPHGEEETEPLSYYHLAQIYEHQGRRREASNYYLQVTKYSGKALQEEVETARKKQPRRGGRM